jgi:aldehyde:ferredoxin oxidoreductase
MNGCIVKCSNIVHDKEGNYVTSALEFETLTLLGSCCDINNWEDVAVLDRLCDELGMDTIEIGAAIAVLMDSEGMQWGDVDAVIKLLQEDIAKGTDIGIMVGNGALSVGKARQHHRVPVVKGQAVPAWDPRSMKATGVTYATSAMGADHTAGLVINPGIGGEAAVLASQESQIVNAVCDSSGFCIFLQPCLDEIRQFYNAFYGDNLSNEQLADLGWQCLEDEWEFNRRAGFSDADDDMVSCLREEGIGPDNALKFDIPIELLAGVMVRQPASDTLYFGPAEG